MTALSMSFSRLVKWNQELIDNDGFFPSKMYAADLPLVEYN